MNTKAIAIVVTTLVVLAGAAVIMTSEQTDAVEAKKLPSLQVLTTGGETDQTPVSTNEGEFRGYDYKMTWFVVKNTAGSDPSQISEGWASLGTTTATATDTTFTFTPEESVSAIDNLTPSMAAADSATVGSYVFTVTPSTPSAGTVSLALKSEIMAIVGGSEQKQTIYYTVDVIVSESAITETTFEAITGNVGAFFGESIVEDDVNGEGIIGDISNYSWFATGLPEGLTMSEAGFVSGIPYAEGTGDASIVATNKYNGETVTGTMAWSVGPAIVPELTDYTVVVKVNNEQQTVDSNMVVVKETDKVTLTVNAKDQADGSNVKLYIDDNDSVDVTLGNEYDIYTPNTGTGSFRVIVECGTTDVETTWFDLYVTSSYEDIEAGIIPIA